MAARGWNGRRGNLQSGNMKESFEGDGTLMYLDCGGGYIIVWVG